MPRPKRLAQHITKPEEPESVAASAVPVRSRAPSVSFDTHHAVTDNAFFQQLDKYTHERFAAISKAALNPNTLRAYQSDLRYFWQWHTLVYPNVDKKRLPYYPIEVAVVARFVADHAYGTHFGDAMKPEVEDVLMRTVVYHHGDTIRFLKPHAGPLKPATLKRYLATLSVMHRPFPATLNPCRDPQIRAIVNDYKQRVAKDAERAARQEHQDASNAAEYMRIGTTARKAAMTATVLEDVIARCDDSPRGLRDKAILSLMFNSGGRRISEAAKLLLSQVLVDGEDYVIKLGITKTNQTDDEENIKPVAGDAAAHLRAWLSVLNAHEATDGFLFRGFNRHGGLRKSLSAKAIATMIKDRAETAGYDRQRFGGHSLRAGYMTEAGYQNIHPFVAMALSDHKSIQVARTYFRPGEVKNSPARNLMKKKNK